MQFRKKLLFIGVINLLALPLAFKNFNSDINIKYNFVTKKELESNVKDRAFTFNVVKNTEKKFINKDKGSVIENYKYILVSKYNFDYKNVTYNGEIYLDENYQLSDIDYSTNKIKESILNNTYNSNGLEDTRVKFNISDKYRLNSETKIATELKNGSGEYFGSFASWRCIYQKDDYSSSTAKQNFIVTYEDYISPNQDKTDYRTDYLSIYFNPNIRHEATLRDYSPKAQNPTGTINVGITSETSISSDGTVTATLGASASYSTNVSSPAIYDKGNMAQNYAQIDYDYLNPKEDNGAFYQYNIGQSCQLAAFRFITSQRSEISIKSPHTVTILRDGLWSNKTLQYEVDCGTGFYVH